MNGIQSYSLKIILTELLVISNEDMLPRWKAIGITLIILYITPYWNVKF